MTLTAYQNGCGRAGTVGNHMIKIDMRLSNTTHSDVIDNYIAAGYDKPKFSLVAGENIQHCIAIMAQIFCNILKLYCKCTL